MKLHKFVLILLLMLSYDSANAMLSRPAPSLGRRFWDAIKCFFCCKGCGKTATNTCCRCIGAGCKAPDQNQDYLCACNCCTGDASARQGACQCPVFDPGCPLCFCACSKPTLPYQDLGNPYVDAHMQYKKNFLFLALENIAAPLPSLSSYRETQQQFKRLIPDENRREQQYADFKAALDLQGVDYFNERGETIVQLAVILDLSEILTILCNHSGIAIDQLCSVRHTREGTDYVEHYTALLYTTGFCRNRIGNRHACMQILLANGASVGIAATTDWYDKDGNFVKKTTKTIDDMLTESKCEECSRIIATASQKKASVPLPQPVQANEKQSKTSEKTPLVSGKLSDKTSVGLGIQ